MKNHLFNEFLAQRFALKAEAAGADEVDGGHHDRPAKRREISEHRRDSAPRAGGALRRQLRPAVEHVRRHAARQRGGHQLHVQHVLEQHPGNRAIPTARRCSRPGSGAGRFTRTTGNRDAVDQFDYSSAVEANWRNNGAHGELLLFQGDIYDMPFDDGTFDFVFCYGVLQHSPDPARAFEALFSKVHPGGGCRWITT